jgi:hypothetical protein
MTDENTAVVFLDLGLGETCDLFGVDLTTFAGAAVHFRCRLVRPLLAEES